VGEGREGKGERKRRGREGVAQGPAHARAGSAYCLRRCPTKNPRTNTP